MINISKVLLHFEYFNRDLSLPPRKKFSEHEQPVDISSLFFFEILKTSWFCISSSSNQMSTGSLFSSSKLSLLQRLSQSDPQVIRLIPVII